MKLTKSQQRKKMKREIQTSVSGLDLGKGLELAQLENALLIPNFLIEKDSFGRIALDNRHFLFYGCFLNSADSSFSIPSFPEFYMQSYDDCRDVFFWYKDFVYIIARDEHSELCGFFKIPKQIFTDLLSGVTKIILKS